jgi:hypothetical protein
MSDNKKQISIRKFSRRLPGGLFSSGSKESFLDSRSVTHALNVIKDAAVEQHTKDNLQILIDQIYESHLTY